MVCCNNSFISGCWVFFIALLLLIFICVIRPSLRPQNEIPNEQRPVYTEHDNWIAYKQFVPKATTNEAGKSQITDLWSEFLGDGHRNCFL